MRFSSSARQVHIMRWRISVDLRLGVATGIHVSGLCAFFVLYARCYTQWSMSRMLSRHILVARAAFTNDVVLSFFCFVHSCCAVLLVVLPHSPFSIVAHELPDRCSHGRACGRGVRLQRVSCDSGLFCGASGGAAVAQLQGYLAELPQLHCQSWNTTRLSCCVYNSLQLIISIIST